MARYPVFTRLAIPVGIWLGLSGCASLTDSQRQTVATYAKLTQTYAQYPSAAAKTYATLYYDIDGLRFATYVGKGSDTSVNDQMWKAHAFRNDALNEAMRLDKAISAIRKYAQALEALSGAALPDNLAHNAGLLGSNLDAVAKQYNADYKPEQPLPIGFGKLAGDVLTLIGKRYVNHRQAVALRAYMTKGDTLLRLITNDAQQAFEQSRATWTDQLKSSLKGNQEMMLGRLMVTNTNYNRVYYAHQLDKDMFALIERIALFDDSMGQIQSSVAILSDAHHSVLEDIRQKRSLKAQVADLQGLYSAVMNLSDNYQKLTALKPNQP